MKVPREVVIVDAGETLSKDDDPMTEAHRLPRPAPVGFRRCSLDHARQVEESKRIQRSARRPAPRRSSLKTSSSYTPGPSCKRALVEFDRGVRVKIIDFRDEAYLEAAWLSKEERKEIQDAARADVKTIKQLAKHRHLLEESPELRQLRSTMSLRGLEQFYSKKVHRALQEYQMNFIYDILELQEAINDASLSFGTQHDKAERIAQKSAEGSLPSRERAIVQGREDEAAIKKYLQQLRSTLSDTNSQEAAPAPAAPPGDAKPAGIETSSRSLDDRLLNRPPEPARQQRRASMPTRPSDSYYSDLNKLANPGDDYMYSDSSDQ